MRRLVGALAALVSLCLIASSCLGEDRDGSIAIMVPSSFTDITGEIDRTGEYDIEWIIASSNRLLRQLEDGAAAQVLITADQETMDRAVEEGLVSGVVAVVATNRLVFAVAPDNPGAISSLDDLARDDLLLGVCADEVPCGRLADEAARALGFEMAADTEEPNVRSLALKIARGELDGGLVYATDALTFGLDTVADDQLSAFVNEYPAASVDGSSTGVVALLRSPEGQELLHARGFGPP